MKSKPSFPIRKTFLTLIVLCALSALFWAGLRYSKVRNERDYATRVLEQGPGIPDPASVKELQSAIAYLEERLNQTVQLEAKAAQYWKILASRLMEMGLYGEALPALEKAITYTPTDPSLYYMTGISSAIMAKSSLAFEGRAAQTEKTRLFALAESAHLHAIALDASYMRPHYALAVLYVFELDRPKDAISHLEIFLEHQSKDIDALFVLARARYMTGDKNKAVEAYDRILDLAKDQKRRAEAEANKKAVLDALYE